MEFWGLTAEEAEPTCDVWPDNADAVDVFCSSLGQWRVGFGGAYALDYNVFPIVAPKQYNSPDWVEIFGDIRIMEEQALKIMTEQQEAERRKSRNG